MNKCKCGCGQEVSKEGNKYIHGHNNNGEKLKELYKAGKIKVWNKGLKKETDSRLYIGPFSEEHKRKISESNKISMNKPEVKELIKKNRTSPVYNDKMKEKMRIITTKLWENKEFREKTTKSHIGKTYEMMHGKEKADKLKEKASQLRIGKSYDEIYGKEKAEIIRNNISLSRYGEDNPAWRGGISDEGYCPIFLEEEFKEIIRHRDGYKCLNPSCSRIYNTLTIHHIDYNKEECGFDNLITICNSCNAKANFDREWHQSWYQTILYKRYGYEY